MNNLHQLTASEAVCLISNGQITSENLVRACLEHISEREPQVKAWAHIDAEAALAAARVIDRTGSGGVLRGIPVGFKDVIDTYDMPTQYNSVAYRGYRPRTDAACAALVRHAGGIVLGKTVTTEFAWFTPGPTRNPHNLEFSPGGSSSGSAAAVADCMVPVAFGTQTGGSNIRPSAYCGIVGYKPSFNTINRAGLKHLAESLDTIGVMGRSVADCALLVYAASARTLPDLNARLPNKPRIGFCRTSRWAAATPETRALLEDVASRLATHGAHVSDVALPDDFDRLYEEQPLISGYESARSLAPEYLARPDLLSDRLRAQIKTHLEMPRDVYAQAMCHARDCRLRFSDVCTEFDILLTPSAPGEAPHGTASTGDPLFNKVWTLLGVPCVTVPVGNGPQGLPLGIQLVGDYDEDKRVLQSAAWVHQALS